MFKDNTMFVRILYIFKDFIDNTPVLKLAIDYYTKFALALGAKAYFDTESPRARRARGVAMENIDSYIDKANKCLETLESETINVNTYLDTDGQDNEIMQKYLNAAMDAAEQDKRSSARKQLLHKKHETRANMNENVNAKKGHTMRAVTMIESIAYKEASSMVGMNDESKFVKMDNNVIILKHLMYLYKWIQEDTKIIITEDITEPTLTLLRSCQNPRLCSLNISHILDINNFTIGKKIDGKNGLYLSIKDYTKTTSCKNTCKYIFDNVPPYVYIKSINGMMLEPHINNLKTRDQNPESIVKTIIPNLLVPIIKKGTDKHEIHIIFYPNEMMTLYKKFENTNNSIDSIDRILEMRELFAFMSNENIKPIDTTYSEVRYDDEDTISVAAAVTRAARATGNETNFRVMQKQAERVAAVKEVKEEINTKLTDSRTRTRLTDGTTYKENVQRMVKIKNTLLANGQNQVPWTNEVKAEAAAAEAAARRQRSRAAAAAGMVADQFRDAFNDGKVRMGRMGRRMIGNRFGSGGTRKMKNKHNITKKINKNSV